MSEDAHARRSEDLAAFALGALTPPEADRVERHLEDCERCRAELRWLRPAAEALPLAVEQLEPPARLRRRLLKTARAEARRDTRPGGLPATPRPALALAIALGVLAAGALGYALRGGGLERSTVALQAAARAPQGAGGELIRYDGSATLDLRGLPPVSGRHVYEAWVREGQRIRPSTVFVPARDGTASAGVPNLGGGEQALVTLEPHGGSRQPTSAPIFTVPLD